MSDQQRQALEAAIRDLEACIEAMKKSNESLCALHDATPEDKCFHREGLRAGVTDSNTEILRSESWLRSLRDWGCRQK